MRECVIGLDVGTTCTKALVVDENGQVLSQGSQGYPLHSDGKKIEQRAEDWVDAARAAIKMAIKDLQDCEIVAISLSTQGGSTVAIDENGDTMGNSWTWMDGRSEEEVQHLNATVTEEYIYKTTGWPTDPSLDAAKILRMKSMPEFKNAKKYLTTLEFVNRWLTGEDFIDPTNAAMRQIFNVEKNYWDETLLKAVGLTEDELPMVAKTGALLGGLTDEAAAETGLAPMTPVFNGAHDQYCASIGAGAVHDGDMLLSAGTTWVLMGVGSKPLFTDSFIAPGKHPVDGLYGAIASLICSGASLQWFKNNFLPEEFDEMNREVAQRKEKAKDLMFFPYQAGANYPLWQNNAKGAFVGIGLEHDRFDFARALMEGVAFGVRRAVEDFRKNGTEIKSITMMGGAAKSEVWMQMIADITGVPIVRLNQGEVCALGAAVIAACGIGFYDSYEEAAKAMVHPEKVFEPQDTVWYEEKFQNFDRMWQCLRQYYK